MPTATPSSGRDQTDPSEGGAVLNALRHPRVLGREVTAGFMTSLALIPESTAFAVVAGLDPRMGLYGAVIVAVVTSVLGGRPGMVSAAAGSVALVAAPLVRSHGVQAYLLAVILSGALQVVLAVCGAAKLMRLIPPAVMRGFVDALAILIFTSQLPDLMGVPWLVYPLTALGLAIILLLPRVTTAVPAPLVAIVVVTVIVLLAGADVPTVGDKGRLPDSLPALLVPDVPFTLETLQLLFPYALGMAVVGLLESLMTAKLVDDITDTRSSKTRESWGQGVANVVSGLFGGMGGCAMVGQTMINVKASGARTRISTFMAGVFVLILSVTLGDVVALVPMAALVAVMIFVSLATFDWHSIRPSTLAFMPKSETAVMLVTVAATVLTHNLAIGVGLGVLAAMVMFAQRVSHLATVTRTLEGQGRDAVARYRVQGELFFASSNDLYTQFDYAGDPARVVIDFSQAHLWDASTIAALDAVEEKYRRHGATVEITGLNVASRAMRARMSGRLGGGH